MESHETEPSIELQIEVPKIAAVVNERAHWSNLLSTFDSSLMLYC
jgi:hypothetical protein